MSLFLALVFLLRTFARWNDTMPWLGNIAAACKTKRFFSLPLCNRSLFILVADRTIAVATDSNQIIICASRSMNTKWGMCTGDVEAHFVRFRSIIPWILWKQNQKSRDNIYKYRSTSTKQLFSFYYFPPQHNMKTTSWIHLCCVYVPLVHLCESTVTAEYTSFLFGSAFCWFIHDSMRIKMHILAWLHPKWCSHAFNNRFNHLFVCYKLIQILKIGE